MNKQLTLLMAQINPTVGAIDLNLEKIIQIIVANQKNHDIIVFPELAITGYPPEDLLLFSHFHDKVSQALKQIAMQVKDCHVIIGHPFLIDNACYNSASIFHQGKKIALYHKQALPNYGVFDEERYFKKGEPLPCIITVKEAKIGLCICEDIWTDKPVEALIKENVKGIISINASPFDTSKYQQREALLKGYAKRGLTMIYVNTVGGQDELVFDGRSMAIDATGKLCARASAFSESLHTIVWRDDQLSGEITPALEEEALIYNALVCGIQNYVEKNGFPGVLIGLSGGIDSALTLAIAVDALGHERVQAVMMPSRYTADISLRDAKEQIDVMQVKEARFSIEPAYEALLQTLQPSFLGLVKDSTEENIQARIRGVLLMALSNKTGYMVLTTSNKSESAVGYATLYGDMAGGFSVLKDVLKTQIYALARYRNTISKVIPEFVLTRPPTAELAENQKDQDTLPDYAILDAIVKARMENNFDKQKMLDFGLPEDAVVQVLTLMKRNEYKRRQSAPGIKISPRAFGRDWRFPITSGFKD